MSHSQFHCTGRAYLDLHGLIFETSICYWQDQPGSLPDVRPVGLTKVDGRPPGASGWARGGGRRAGGGGAQTGNRGVGFEKNASRAPARYGRSSVPVIEHGSGPVPAPGHLDRTSETDGSSRSRSE